MQEGCEESGCGLVSEGVLEGTEARYISRGRILHDLQPFRPGADRAGGAAGRSDDPDLVGNVQRVEVGGEPDVRLL